MVLDIKKKTMTATNNTNRGTTILKKFLEEQAQSTQLSPLSNVRNNSLEKNKLTTINSYKSPVAVAINTFENEEIILNQLSQIGSTPEKRSEKITNVLYSSRLKSFKSTTNNRITNKHKNVSVSKPSKPLVQTYKLSNQNSAGARRLERFFKEYSQEPLNRPLSNILNCLNQKNRSEKSWTKFNNGTTKNYDNIRSKRPTSTVKNNSPSGKSFSSSNSIHRKSTLFGYLKKTKNITQRVRQNSFSRTSRSAVSRSSENKFCESIFSTKYCFSDKDRKGCDRTKSKLDGNLAILDEEEITGKEYNSPVYRGLDFIEKFDEEYGKQYSKNGFHKAYTKSPCSSKSDIKRKFRSQKLDQWLKKHPIQVDNQDIVDLKNTSTDSKFKKTMLGRRGSSEISFKTKAKIRNKRENNQKLENNYRRIPKQSVKMHKKEPCNKNTITRYFSKSKLVDNKEYYGSYSSKLKEKEEQFTKNINKINIIENTSSCNKLPTGRDKFLKNTHVWMNRNKDCFNSQTFEQKQNIVEKKFGSNSITGNTCFDLKPVTEKRTQRNFYSSEGFYESMSLEPSNNRQSLLTPNHRKKDPDLLKEQNSQKINSIKNEIKNSLTTKYNELSSVFKSLCSQSPKLSPKLTRKKLTLSEERDLSPDTYMRKMCGPESEALVKRILNSHKSTTNDNTKEAKDVDNLVYFSDTGDIQKMDSQNDTGKNGIGLNKLENFTLNKDSFSDPLSFGSTNLTCSENRNSNKVNEGTTLIKDAKGVYQIAGALHNQTKNTVKRRYETSTDVNLNKQATINSQFASPLHARELTKKKTSPRNLVLQNNSQLTQKKEKLQSQTLESLYKLHESNSWSTQEQARKKENEENKYLLEKQTPCVVSVMSNNNQEIGQNKMQHESARKRPTSLNNLTAIQKLLSSEPELFTTQDDSSIFPAFDLLDHCQPVHRKEDENISFQIKENGTKEPNPRNNQFFHKLLRQNYDSTLNENQSDFKWKHKNAANLHQSQINVYQAWENCGTTKVSDGHNPPNYEELDTQIETQKAKKRLSKTYNITEECVLYEDNLLKSLVEEKRGVWKISPKRKILKRNGSKDSLKYGRTYIKRYKKGQTKIFKIKRRVSRKCSENYKPPEGEIMDRFLKKLNNGFEDESSSNSDSATNIDRSVSTPMSYKTDETKSEVLSTGSSKLTDAQKLLRQGINKLSKDKSLLFSKVEDSVPARFNKYKIISNIEHIVEGVLEDFELGRNPVFKVPKENIFNCYFADGREIYYQLKTIINSQWTTDKALKDISRMLNVGLWALNITAQKGLVYGNLKLVLSEGETINCNVPGTLIPQDISKICEVQSTAYFILVVEKESIFHKLLEENLPNRLTRPFILITGKGFPDLNTQLFLKKLWMVMSIPVFILVDADPDGIAIMLNYRFGSIANAHVSEYLAIPKARWLGVFPSEILRLALCHEDLTKREISMSRKLLQLPCVQENEKIKRELEKLLENEVKIGIEGLLKTDTYLSNCYLSRKFFSNDLI